MEREREREREKERERERERLKQNWFGGSSPALLGGNEIVVTLPDEGFPGGHIFCKVAYFDMFNASFDIAFLRESMWPNGKLGSKYLFQ